MLCIDPSPPSKVVLEHMKQEQQMEERIREASELAKQEAAKQHQWLTEQHAALRAQ